MGEFLETLLNMSISGAIISVVIILLRIPLRKAPRRYSYLLWSILGIRLLCPFSLPSPASLFNLFSNGTDSGRVKLTISENIGTAVTQPITGNIVHPLRSPTVGGADGRECLRDTILGVGGRSCCFCGVDCGLVPGSSQEDTQRRTSER